MWFYSKIVISNNAGQLLFEKKHIQSTPDNLNL